MGAGRHGKKQRASDEGAPLVLEERLDADKLGFKHKLTLYVLFCGATLQRHDAAQ
jgi:hypothetical protein